MLKFDHWKEKELVLTFRVSLHLQVSSLSLKSGANGILFAGRSGPEEKAAYNLARSLRRLGLQLQDIDRSGRACSFKSIHNRKGIKAAQSML